MSGTPVSIEWSRGTLPTAVRVASAAKLEHALLSRPDAKMLETIDIAGPMRTVGGIRSASEPIRSRERRA